MTVFKIVLDVILLAIVAFIIIRSVTKGFVASVLKLSRIIVAVLITVLLGGTVANLCAEWFVGAWFEGAGSVIGTVLAALVLAFFVYMLVRKNPYGENGERIRVKGD